MLGKYSRYSIEFLYVSDALKKLSYETITYQWKSLYEKLLVLFSYDLEFKYVLICVIYYFIHFYSQDQGQLVSLECSILIIGYSDWFITAV